MAKGLRKMAAPVRGSGTTKYDAHNSALNRTYGALADLRRELADTKAAVAERTETLTLFADCADSQRAWLLLEDYFEKLSLSRRDFPGEDWWPRLLAVTGKARLEGVAHLFIRAKRSLPTELTPYANFDRFAEIEAAEHEHRLVQQLENWLLPAAPVHLDAPRAELRVVCQPEPSEGQPALHNLAVRLHLSRPRTGSKLRTPAEIVELTTRSAHEQELFSAPDWQFIQWLAETLGENPTEAEKLLLNGPALLQWLARWGHADRLELPDGNHSLEFHGDMVALTPHLETVGNDLVFTHRLALPGAEPAPLNHGIFFAGLPSLVLAGNKFFLLRDAPPPALLEQWSQQGALPVKKLSHRLLTHLRKTSNGGGAGWEELCVTHKATPQFMFELSDDTVRLRLLARSDRDQKIWQWNGHEWQQQEHRPANGEKPEVLDDPRLEAAAHWLRRLDWFTPEPGVWVGDANENFLGTLAMAWPDRPNEAEYLGNPAFHRLFLAPRKLRPKLVMNGSGIDWLSVSVEWEQEGLKLSKADLERLQTATGRFVKLPDGGWMELETEAVEKAHETFAELGLDGLSGEPQKVALLHAAQWDESTLSRFDGKAHIQALRERLKNFTGVPNTDLPGSVQAELRPYQKSGFEFLCHLTNNGLGGILADDMGLGKTLQTLTWLTWLQEKNVKKPKPSLVICPASVLHN
ncbi:MAG TPA: DEAD/DEAH box helicase, partial [Verrucomicrobiae bacterium]|nr:DEAD/DEAH box helicase [Verrucomicrobiae bacterium]